MTQKIYLIAGEASGDNIGEGIIKELKQLLPHAEFFGVGGSKMQAEGLNLLFPMHKISVMGFTEVVPKIPEILKLINLTALDIAKVKPDVVITIDSPDFVFRVVKKCKDAQIQTKFAHVVAPSVWAYKKGRAKKVAKLYNKLFCFLPFEPKYFTEHGLDAEFVGHPIITKLQPFIKETARQKNKIIAMPGSRMSEIKRLWPIYLQVFAYLKQDYKDLQIIVPTLPNLIDYLKTTSPVSLPIKYITNDADKYEYCNKVGAALVKSGTSSLELAIFKVPMVVTYKVSKLTGWLARKLLKIKYVSLINILSDKEIIPELLQENATPKNLYNKLKEIIEGNYNFNYEEAIEKLKIDDKNSSQVMAEKIHKLLEK